MSSRALAVTKRGRPSKGERALTATERKRAQRQRDSQAALGTMGDEQNTPLRVLLAILGRVHVSELARLSAQRAWVEIGRRYGFVTTTE